MRLVLSLFLLLPGVTLKAEAPQAERAAPCTLVIFGASGDLTTRKLLPALYRLELNGRLPAETTIVALSRSEETDPSYRDKMNASIDAKLRSLDTDQVAWKRLSDRLLYQKAEFDEDADYERLHKRLTPKPDPRIYYLAVPPSYFSLIVEKIHRHGLLRAQDRVIIEKPFGTDLPSALKLQEDLSKYLQPDQIYRMDHYLGKDGVQDLLDLRFRAAIVENIWNNRFIDNVQITLAEDLGIGTRAQFWEETGTLRDVIQNHVMQILALVAMEPPESLQAAHLHTKKVELLKAIRPLPSDALDRAIIRAQYSRGTIGEHSVPGYHEEQGVAPTSTSETYVAGRLFIDNPRWRGVPFYLRSGKRLPKQTTEIVIRFKEHLRHLRTLFIRIQPNPGVFVDRYGKIQPVAFQTVQRPSQEGYERLLFDCMQGDRSLFVPAEEQLIAWQLLTPVLAHWKEQGGEGLDPYPAGSWGPNKAKELLGENGRQWQLLPHEVNTPCKLRKIYEKEDHSPARILHKLPRSRGERAGLCR